MSFSPTSFRPLARCGWGGRASNHFRGLLSADNYIGEDRAPQMLGPSWRGQVGTVVWRGQGAESNYRITGVTRDSSGSILGNCRVELLLTANDCGVQETTSDASGNFTFESPGTGPFYIVAYKAGSPDVAGTSVNTLIAS